MLHEFLENLAEAGESHELDLGFSIDPSRLAERFATFEINEPGYCLVRIVQGLVRLNASKIDLKIARQRIVLRAHLPDPESVAAYIKPEKLELMLGRPGLWNRTSGHLCVGLLASGAASIKRLTWTHGHSQLRSDGSGFEIVESKRVAGLEVVLEKAKTSSSTSQEHINLLSRLHRCPVPITLDHRLITCEPFKPKNAVWHQACSGAFFLVEGNFAEHLHTDVSPLKEDFDTAPGSSKSAQFLCSRTRKEWTGQLVIAVGLEGSAKLYPIIDGVVGDLRDLYAAPGATGFYHPPETCKTDLSGLKLVDLDAFSRVALTDYLLLLERALHHLEHVRAVQRTPSKSFSEAAKTLFFSGSPEAMLMTPLYGLAWGLRSSYYSLSFRTNRKAYERDLREQLGTRLRTRIAGARRALDGLSPD